MSGPQNPGLVGSVLGGSYRITRLIGQGGMGAVYEGVQTRLERRVAVKLMARELSSNPEAIARFRREAEVTSQIGHPHIVQVFDFGQAPGGEPYLVMEYLEGEDLEKRSSAWASCRWRRRRQHRPAGLVGAVRDAREGDRPPRSETRERLPAVGRG